MSIQLSKPRSAIAEVLYSLITRPEISEQEFQMNGFRSRISELKNEHKIPVRSREKKGKSRHGNPMTYTVRYLWRISIPRAKRIYQKINGHG